MAVGQVTKITVRKFIIESFVVIGWRASSLPFEIRRVFDIFVLQIRLAARWTTPAPFSQLRAGISSLLGLSNNFSLPELFSESTFLAARSPFVPVRNYAVGRIILRNCIRFEFLLSFFKRVRLVTGSDPPISVWSTTAVVIMPGQKCGRMRSDAWVLSSSKFFSDFSYRRYFWWIRLTDFSFTPTYLNTMTIIVKWAKKKAIK